MSLDAEHAANLFALKEFGNIYTRINNPTTDVFERRIAAIEGGTRALAVASGQAAQTLALLAITGSQGRDRLRQQSVQAPISSFTTRCQKLSRTVKFISSGNPEAIRQAITPKTQHFTPRPIGNPKLDVPDFEALAAIAKEAGIPFIVDNTVGVGLVRPIDHGGYYYCY